MHVGRWCGAAGVYCIFFHLLYLGWTGWMADRVLVNRRHVCSIYCRLSRRHVMSCQVMSCPGCGHGRQLREETLRHKFARAFFPSLSKQCLQRTSRHVPVLCTMDACGWRGTRQSFMSSSSALSSLGGVFQTESAVSQVHSYDAALRTSAL